MDIKKQLLALIITVISGKNLLADAEKAGSIKNQNDANMKYPRVCKRVGKKWDGNWWSSWVPVENAMGRESFCACK